MNKSDKTIQISRKELSERNSESLQRPRNRPTWRNCRPKSVKKCGESFHASSQQCARHCFHLTPSVSCTNRTLLKSRLLRTCPSGGDVSAISWLGACSVHFQTTGVILSIPNSFLSPLRPSSRSEGSTSNNLFKSSTTSFSNRRR